MFKDKKDFFVDVKENPKNDFFVNVPNENLEEKYSYLPQDIYDTFTKNDNSIVGNLKTLADTNNVMKYYNEDEKQQYMPLAKDLYYEDFLQKRDEWENKHPFISEMQKAVQPLYESRRKVAENYLNNNNEENFKSVLKSEARPMVNAALTLGSLGLGGAAMNGVRATKMGAAALKAHPYLTPAVTGAVATAPENAIFGVTDKGLADLQGAPTEETYGEAARNGALFGAALHGLLGAGRAGANWASKTPIAKNINKGYNDLLNSGTPVGNRLAKVQGVIQQALNLKSNNAKVGKMQEFSNKMSRYNAPLQNKATREQLENLQKAENFNNKEARQMRRHAWSGEYNKDTWKELAERDGKTADEVVNDFKTKQQEHISKKQVDEDRNISPEEFNKKTLDKMDEQNYKDLQGFYNEAYNNWENGKISNEQMKIVSDYYNKEMFKYNKLKTDTTRPINEVKTSSDVITPKEDVTPVNEPSSGLRMNKPEGEHKHNSRIKVMNQKQPTISSQPKTLEGGLEYNEPVVREERTTNYNNEGYSYDDAISESRFTPERRIERAKQLRKESSLFNQNVNKERKHINVKSKKRYSLNENGEKEISYSEHNGTPDTIEETIDGKTYKRQFMKPTKEAYTPYKEFTEGEENIYKDVEREDNSLFDPENYDKKTYEEFNKKYKVMPDGETWVYKSGKREGRVVDKKEFNKDAKALADTRKEKPFYDNNNSKDYDKYEGSNAINEEDSTKIKAKEKEDYENLFADTDNMKYGTYDEDTRNFLKYIENDGDLKRKVKLEQKLKNMTPEERYNFVEELRKHQEHTAKSAASKNPGELPSKTANIYDEAVDSIAHNNFKVHKQAKISKYKAEDAPLSANEQRHFNDAWKKVNTHKGKASDIYVKGTLNRLWNNEAEAQKVYDEAVEKLFKIDATNRVKSSVLKKLNSIVDNYNSKNGKNIKTQSYNANSFLKKEINELEQSVANKDLNKTRQQLKNTNLNPKNMDSYDAAKVRKLQEEHYNRSTENTIERLKKMGVEEIDGREVKSFNEDVALSYAREKILKSGKPEKTINRMLSYLEKYPKQYINNVRKEAYDLISRQENVLKYDVVNSKPKDMTTVKPIGKTKGTDKQYHRESVGDSPNWEIGNRDQGIKEGEARVRNLKESTGYKSEYDSIYDEPNPETRVKLSNKNAQYKYKEFLNKNKSKEKVEFINNLVELRQKADNVYNSRTISKEHNVMDYFSKEERKILGDFEIIEYKNDNSLSNGKSVLNLKEIFVKTGERTKEEVESTLRHEIDHLLQQETAKSWKNDSIEYKNYVNARDIASNSAKFINNNFMKLAKCKNRNLRNKIYKFSEIEDITLDDLNKVKETIRKSNANLTTEEKEIFNDYVEAVYEYKNNILEKRAKNASKNIKNEGDLKDDLETYIKEYDERRNEGNSIQTNRNDRLEENKQNNKRRKERLDNSTIHDMYEVDPSIPEVSQDVKDVTEYYENLSRHQQAIKEKLGIITEEQALGKLRKQGSEKGVYVKPVFKGSNKIDLKRDYNQSRDTKEGQFGKVKREGIRSAKANDYLKAMIEEDNKASHINDVLNYVEREFARDIPENGVIPKGYKAVNKFVLSNAMWGEFTPAWYETMVQGKKSIESVFKNPGVAKAWTDKFEKFNNNDYMLPDVIFDELFTGKGETVRQYWQRYGYTHTGKAILKTGGAILDVMNNSFKRGVLTSGSFFTNNRFGNSIMIAAKEGPIEYLKSFYGATKIKTSDLPSELAESSIMEAFDQVGKRASYTGWQPLDNFFNLINGVTFETKNLKGMDKLKAKTANAVLGLPNKWFNSLSNKLMNFNQHLENFERRQAYSIQLNKMKPEVLKTTGRKMIAQEELLKHIKDHPELEEVIIKNIEDTLGDYNNFNKYEKTVLKRFIPFYSWYRTITRHTLSLMKENPTRAAMIWLELRRMEARDKDTMKEYQRGAIKTGIKDPRSGKELIVNKVAQIPYNTFKEVYQDAKGGIAPSLRVTGEGIRGTKYFNNSEITSRRYVRQKEGYGNKAKYVYLDTKTGKKLNKIPTSVKAKYLGKELGLKTMYPILSSPLIKLESLIQGGSRALQGKGFLEPDKIYDSDLGGYYTGDKVPYSKKGRYAANNLSEGVKILNRAVGGIQNKASLNAEEKEEIRKRKIKEYNEKHKKRREK